VSLKQYANLDYGDGIQQTHFRSSGSGSPLILLHPSPLSSAFMEPLISLFEGMASVYAPDTPGYGASDPLPDPGEDLVGYVEWLRRFMLSQGLKSAGIYGSATGAQIAIQFARTFPEMTDYVVLDNAVHFTDEERAQIMALYFPDMSPKADGSHLQQAWDMSSKVYQYFPWFDQSDKGRVTDREPPVELVHATALNYLLAGTDYDRAYRAAFNNEDARNVQAIKGPVRVMRWQGSILRRYADRLDHFTWPENVQMVHCDSTIESRYAALENVIRELA